MLLTKSQVYAIVREVINYKKSTNNTVNVTSHVEDCGFADILSFIKEHADHILVKRLDHPDASIAPHIKRLEYLFDLPTLIDTEYNYCIVKND
ncbi:LEF-11 [Choristoneura occidentalis granulovirus]|uniref:Late expression factor 11 n=2 Tax=Betabaculovirus chofumiferanae TaxID=3051997 RepID=Q8B581_GVCF|nr:LEF-11 [Choristoneura fumiferana granulovirus]AAN77198.1 late expression factor LEF-11 [Choristoneura fumiferana granulovirus]ABC61177.1 LEF-11 [Choristoneura fumiferana granulovirus]